LLEIDNILKKFDAISLADMNSVQLLNRMDTKFIFNINKLPSVFADLQQNYFVLDICGIRKCLYKTLYYDTDDLKMYIQHHNGKLNRYKVRTRKYIETNDVFFEIKYKNNLKRTIKQRVNTSQDEKISKKAGGFLIEKAPFKPEDLKPAIFVYYYRITFVSKLFNERITFDVGLSFKKDEEKASYPNLVIAELKQDKSTKSFAFSILRKHRIPNISISKYCLGICSLYNNVKKNRFKPKLKEINRICYENF